MRSAKMLLLYRPATRLPLSPAPRHRPHVRVSHLLQIVSGKSRSKSPSTIKNQLRSLIRYPRRDVALQYAPAEVLGPTSVTSRPFAFLANVNQSRLSAVESVTRFADADLAHPRPRVVDEPEERGRMFHK